MHFLSRFRAIYVVIAVQCLVIGLIWSHLELPRNNSIMNGASVSASPLNLSKVTFSSSTGPISIKNFYELKPGEAITPVLTTKWLEEGYLY